MTVRLRVLPIPDGPYPLAYGARMNAPKITVGDVGAASDPEVGFPIPGGWDESVLLPMALKRFSGHPAFGNGNPNAAAEIDRQYKAAQRIIRGAAPNRAAMTMVPTFR